MKTLKKDIEIVTEKASSLGMFDSVFDYRMEELNEQMQDLLDELDDAWVHRK